MLVEHYFPVDGIYDIRTTFRGNSLSAIRGLQFRHQFELSVDGERVRLVSIGGPADRPFSRVGRTASGEKRVVPRRYSPGSLAEPIGSRYSTLPQIVRKSDYCGRIHSYVIDT